LYQWILRICEKGQKLKKHAFGSQTFVALRRTLAGSLHAEK
jgi:ureidoglycolate hydrolase